MPESVPRIGQAFVYSVVLRTGAGAVVVNPDDAATGFEDPDCDVYFGTLSTPVTPALDDTGSTSWVAQRGTTPVLDIHIGAADHTASPVVIVMYDRDASAYLPIIITLFTIDDTKLKYDGSYIRETTTADVVQRHWSAGLVGGSLVIGAAVEGDVP